MERINLSWTKGTRPVPPFQSLYFADQIFVTAANATLSNSCHDSANAFRDHDGVVCEKKNIHHRKKFTLLPVPQVPPNINSGHLSIRPIRERTFSLSKLIMILSKREISNVWRRFCNDVLYTTKTWWIYRGDYHTGEKSSQLDCENHLRDSAKMVNT